MARKPRDTWNYELKRGRSIVYHGITNDPERRVREHLAEGKDFDRMRVIGSARTRDRAERDESDALSRFRRGHGGENPEYNKKPDGK